MYGFPNAGFNNNLVGGFNHGNNFHQQQPQQVQQQPKNIVKCKMVTSLEEVKAMPIDFDGSLNVYVDVTNNKIYTKVFTVNATVDIKTYVIGESEDVSNNKYATIEDINQIKKELEDLKVSLGG